MVVPTRELALQVHAEALRFGANAVALHGGVPKETQARQLEQRQPQLVVATPGRLLDQLGRHRAHQANDGLPRLSAAQVSLLVLDEADRLLELGFDRDVRAIVAACSHPQRLLLSATWPAAVRRAAAALLRPSYATVRLANAGGDGDGDGDDDEEALPVASRAITQRIHVVAPRERWETLLRLLEDLHLTLVTANGRSDDEGAVATPPPGSSTQKQPRAIVFATKKADVHAIGEHCTSATAGGGSSGGGGGGSGGWWAGRCDVLSGDRTQQEREDVVRRFRNGELTLLIATDVAARGLDVPGVQRVLCYDFPAAEAYVHRIGRTGRSHGACAAGESGEGGGGGEAGGAGAEGGGGGVAIADTIFTRKEAKHARALMRILEAAGQVVPAQLREWAKSKEEHLGDKAASEAAAVEAAQASGTLGAQGVPEPSKAPTADPEVVTEDSQAAAARRKKEEKERKAKAFREEAEALALRYDSVAE